MADGTGYDGGGNALSARQRLTTWALRDALDGERWWEKVPREWRQHVDGLWRRKGAATATIAKKKVYRPLVVRFTESGWSLERFLAHRRRVGRRDEQVAAAKVESDSEAVEVIVATCRRNENDTACRRMLYRARQQATHAVVAVVPEHGPGRRTEEYLGLCAGGDRGKTQSSGSEERLAGAFKTLGVQVQRQAPVGRYRLDFLVRGVDGDTDIEVDGRYWHTDENGERLPEDHWRDEVLAAVGIRTVRVWAEDVNSDPKGAAEYAMQQHRK